MILHIDTSGEDTLVKLLSKDGNISDQIIWLADKDQSEKLLSNIAVLLERNGLSRKDLQKIQVNTGPRSYTGLRIGIATANALAFGLNIPVVAEEFAKKKIKTNEFNTPVLPKYFAPAKITKEKSRLRNV